MVVLKVFSNHEINGPIYLRLTSLRRSAHKTHVICSVAGQQHLYNWTKNLVFKVRSFLYRFDVLCYADLFTINITEQASSLCEKQPVTQCSLICASLNAGNFTVLQFGRINVHSHP